MIKTLRPDIEKYIAEQVEVGDFATPEALVEAAVGDMRDRKKQNGVASTVELCNIDDLDEGEIDADLQASIDEARAQLDRGEGIPFEEFKAHWQKKLHRA